MTAKQAERARRREHGRVQRITWSQDRWAAGSTVSLGAQDEAFMVDLRGAGFDPAACSPATLDAARWAWLNVQTRRMTIDQFRDRVDWHAAKDAAAG